MTIGAPLEDFPSDSMVEDTRHQMQALEDYIRPCREQDCWIHWRFKDRPASLPNNYRTLKQSA